MNTYSLEEKTTKSSTYRSIRVQASDDAVDAFTGRLPFGSNTPLRPLNFQETPSENIPLALPDKVEKTIMGEPNNNISSADIHTGMDSNGLSEVNSLFTEHSGHGIIPSKTLIDYIQQLPTKKEKQQTFAIMFVWGCNQRNSKAVSHEDLVAVMKHEDLYDSNSYRHLPEVANNYFKTVNNGYEVNNYDGMQRVNDIIEDIRNPEQKRVSTETKKPTKKGRPSGSTNKEELEIVKPWLDMPIEALNNFDVRKLHVAWSWGAFSLYILTKLLKVQETVKVGVIYTFLRKKYPTMSVSRRTFRDAMNKDKKRFSLSAGGAYSLTEIGEKDIEKLIKESGST